MTYIVTVVNDGAAPTDGSPVTVSDFLPPGLTLNPSPSTNVQFQAVQWDNDVFPCDPGPPASCTISEVIYPGQDFVAFFPVNVAPNAPALVTNHVTVSGGGAPDATASEQTPVTSTPAAFGFQSSRFSLTDAAGAAQTRSGSHPYQLNVSFLTNTSIDKGNSVAAGSLKNVSARLPDGLVVNPNASLVRCTEAQFETNRCPDESAVGLAQATTGIAGYATSAGGTVPLYNLVPPPGVPAAFGFDPIGLGIFIHLLGGVDAAGNYVLTADARDIPQYGATSGASIFLWGDPSDPSHDRRRGRCGYPGSGVLGRCPVAANTVPLLTMPSACSSSLDFSFRASSWEDPGNFESTFARFTDEFGQPVSLTGCEQLDFDPAISVKPDSSSADSPSGLDVDLTVPQTDTLSTLATSTLKDAVVTLPAGMSVNPSAADGLEGCSSAQIGIGSKSDPTCPNGSKIGTVSVDTPLLDDPLQGSIFLAAQNDNPSHSVLALYLVAQGSGVTLKLVGEVHADPATGQLTATFENQPQLPFNHLSVHFNSGPRASLATPDNCGTYSTASSLSPWSGAPAVTSTDAFAITSGCAGGFAPAFTAGVATPSAGRSSAFTLQIARSDGQEHIRSVNATLPPGLLADIGSVPLCGDADAAAGTCSDASRVGSTDTAAGPGTNPFHLPGKVFLTGPYNGGPYGLSVVVPAKAGPFDLGTVVVRASIRVDPNTAQVTTVSDDVPNILRVEGADGQTEGFPLRIRSIAVNIDRPRFTVNPTSCDATSITGTLGSWEGSGAPVSSRFQIGDCAALAFKPKLALALTGKRQVKTGRHPGVKALVVQPAKGAAAISKAAVTLPKSLALDPDNAQALCEFADGTKPDLENHCPKGSIVGRARAVTPLLNKPLSGNVYFVKNVRRSKTGNLIRTLPMIVVALRGDIAINLKGVSSTTKGGKLVSTFPTVPDAPVTRFNLNIAGGTNGILAVTRTAKSKLNLCKATQTAVVDLDGHNGKQADFNTRVKTPCAKKAKKAKRKK